MIIEKRLCTQCKNLHAYDEDIFECEMGRHTELRKAKKEGFLTECQYWEARK